MQAKTSKLEGVLLFDPVLHRDSRGYFVEVYKTSTFEKYLARSFVQDNLSMSSRGVIRGFHYQLDPRAQGKLVQCMTGSIYDVVVDVRQGSPTYGQWEGISLSSEGHQMLYVPEGFAHGFQALEDNTRVFYKCTSLYSKEHERGIRFDDPTLAVKWPLPAEKISPKDLELPFFK
ncbi:MAG: dTDP-4-dehydrorhamnose 3,5-epimerase [Bdellovibrionales bacterium]